MIYFKKKLRRVLKRIVIKIYFLVGIKKEIIDHERTFKKVIIDGQIIISEIFKHQPVENKKLFIESKSDYILHIFNGKKTRNYIYYNPNHKYFPINLVNLISLMIVHGSGMIIFTLTIRKLIF